MNVKQKTRFLRYVAIDTGADENSGTHPSSDKQWTLARLLEQELKDLGAQDVRVSDTCTVYASFPANAENQPAIGFIAHMDTSSSVPTGPVHARSVFYAGGDLGGRPRRRDDGKSLSRSFPEKRRAGADCHRRHHAAGRG